MAQAKQDVLPAFEVEKLDGTRTVIKLVPIKDDDGNPVAGGGFEEKEIEIEAGYMVYFPRGHSIRLTEEKLREMGFAGSPDMVDMESGDVVGKQPSSLKQRVERVTKPGRASSA